MVTREELSNRKKYISVIGLGYVGLPIAVSFARKTKVIAFDINIKKIEQYKNNIDITGEVGNKELEQSNVFFTYNASDLKKASFHIVAVPTPVSIDNTPDLSLIESASNSLGNNLVSGSIVVFESTVYPGVTEEVCIPILEKTSGLKCGIDFFVGYSPERINPGDKINRLENIVKIVSGQNEQVCDIIAEVYELVVEVGVYKASSIKVAEAAKIVENIQRDINIAFMNELSIIFKHMNIDTLEVLKAAETKWNFIKFVPGLVGGHCIGVDPYYLTYKAQQLGYKSQIILSSRQVNDYMGCFIAQSIIKEMIRMKKHIYEIKIGILGLTFKENCSDIRNTKVIDIINELKSYGIEPQICDPYSDKKEAMNYYGINLVELNELKYLDCLVIAVSHTEFYKINIIEHLNVDGLLADIKGIYDKKEIMSMGYSYWRL
ncbi:MAG: nucleotide sugar dehydrogenase [Defluviitaleaceae bacterium]|nr:nucleotide sugar dehydrogenase [Defluviitaleaceae bacterium]